MTSKLEDFFIFYIIKRAILEVVYFFVHWYKDGFLFLWKKFRDILASLDYIFAVKITLRHWLEPLYQDRTIVGIVLGPIFRTFRILFGFYLYFLIFVAWLAVLLAWLALPIVLIWGALFDLPLTLF